MRSASLIVTLLLATQSLAAGPPAPPPQFCVDDICKSTESESGYEFPVGPKDPSSAELKAVPTFNNIGLYWKEASGASTNEALVRFRKSGTSRWRQGLSLWFDDRTSTQIPYGFEEYRGSIVGLEPNSTYEVEVLTAGSRKLASTQVRTWSENFPVGSTVILPAKSGNTLSITQSGTPDGYILYTAAAGQSATIDVAKSAEDNIRISASYVIIRGLTLKNARRNGIVITKTAHHVVIENNDISSFGKADPDAPQFACNGSAGITTEEVASESMQNGGVKQLVIQNNRIHHPSFDSNSWEESRPSGGECGPRAGDERHPAGSAAMFFKDTGGNHVIRYNEIYSDFTHMFDDGLSGGQNFSVNGDLRRDSDIYGNRVSHVWDDAIQSEGAGMNIRIYENYTENVLTAFSNATVSIGPLYLFRNVATKGVRDHTMMQNEGKFWKTRNKSTDGTVARIYIGGGRVYLFHNTAYQTSSSDAVGGPLNVDSISLVNVISRNNIWHTKAAISSKYTPMDYADFNHDMFAVGHTAWRAEESKGIESNPVYDPTSGSGKYALKAGTAGHDSGVRIPNFNDDFSGGGPDHGAQENGQKALQFGTR
jgi:hypothetical protein